MNTQTTKTVEQLKEEKRILLSKLGPKNHDEILALLRVNEKEIKELSMVELINKVNAKYSRLRELARQAYECEQPTEDITCNDGSFHKAKVKKYPKIASLQYCSAKWEDERITVLRINGEKFTMYSAKYEHGKPTEYSRPVSFQDFLQLNHIPIEDITISQYNEITEKLEALNEQLQADIEKYKNGLKSLNYYSLDCWGLISQHPLNLYEYTPNK